SALNVRLGIGEHRKVLSHLPGAAARADLGLMLPEIEQDRSAAELFEGRFDILIAACRERGGTLLRLSRRSRLTLLRRCIAGRERHDLATQGPVDEWLLLASGHRHPLVAHAAERDAEVETWHREMLQKRGREWAVRAGTVVGDSARLGGEG